MTAVDYYTLRRALEPVWAGARVSSGRRPPPWVRVIAFERFTVLHEIDESSGLVTTELFDLGEPLGEDLVAAVPTSADAATIAAADLELERWFRTRVAPAFLSASAASTGFEVDAVDAPMGFEILHCGNDVVEVAAAVWGGRFEVVARSGDEVHLRVRDAIVVRTQLSVRDGAVTLVGPDARFQLPAVLGRPLNTGRSVAALTGNYRAIDEWLTLHAI